MINAPVAGYQPGLIGEPDALLICLWKTAVNRRLMPDRFTRAPSPLHLFSLLLHFVLVPCLGGRKEGETQRRWFGFVFYGFIQKRNMEVITIVSVLVS